MKSLFTYEDFVKENKKETRKLLNYKKEINILHDDIYINKKDKTIDDNMTYEIFDAFFENLVSIDDLNEFIQKNKDEISRVINNENENGSYFYSQPAALILIYYLFKNTELLKIKWPFTNEALKKLFYSFGYSYEI